MKHAIILFVLICTNLHLFATTKTFVSGNTNTAGSWSPSGVPGSADVVIFDGTSGAATVNSNLNVGSINFTGYTNTITMTSTITTFGAVTLSSGMTISGSGNLISAANGTWTSNAKTWSAGLSLGAFTITLVGNWIQTGNSTTSGVAVVNKTTSETLNINGGTFTATNAISGTADIVFGTTGNPTWTGNAIVSNNIIFNTSGTFTISGTVSTGAITITYTAGTPVTTGSSLFLNGNTTFATSGMSWNNITVNTINKTYTLNSALTVGGTLSVQGFNSTFSGTAGFSTNTFTANLTNGNTPTVTFQINITYAITNQFNAYFSGSVSGTFKSSTTSTTALLNYTGTTTCDKMNVFFANFTDIDASGGNKIWDLGSPTLTRTTNIGTVTSGTYPPVTIFGN